MENYLLVIDSVISLLLFGPLVAAYWRGTWGIADMYLFPDDKFTSRCVSLLTGLVISFSLMLLQDKFSSWNSKIGVYSFLVLSRAHSYVLGLASVHYWRGVWGMLDFIGTNVQTATLTTVMTSILLVGIRGMCDTVSPPLFTMTDLGRKDYFALPTRFKTKPRLSLRFTVDCCFTLLCVLATVVAQWHGIWKIADHFLASHDLAYSSWLSMGLGIVFTTFLLTAQWPVMQMAKKLRRKETKLYVLVLIEDAMSLSGNIATVLVWRGFWNLQDQYIVINNPSIVWVLHVVSVILLILLLHFKTATLVGAWTDGDVINSEEKIFFDTKFITSILKHRKRKYEISTRSAEDDSKTNNGISVISINKQREHGSDNKAF